MRKDDNAGVAFAIVSFILSLGFVLIDIGSGVNICKSIGEGLITFVVLFFIFANIFG